MGIQESVESDRRGPGGTCPIGLLVRGEVPDRSTAPPLEADDREYLANVTQPNSSHPTAMKLYRTLREQGYSVGPAAVGKHRLQGCSCWSRIR